MTLMLLQRCPPPPLEQLSSGQSLGRLDIPGYFLSIQDASARRATAGATASDSLGHPVAGSIGLGFAVPAATAERVAKSLINSGRVVHGTFGVSVVPVLGPNSEITPGGLYITSIDAGGPAAGLV